MKPFLSLLLCATMATVLAAQQAGAPQNVTPEQAEKLIREKKVVVLDLRTPGEFAKGKIAGARNLDYLGKSFEAELAQLDKKQPYLIHCASGNRSGKAMELFKKLQFQTVYHLASGMQGWEKEGKPVEK